MSEVDILGILFVVIMAGTGYILWPLWGRPVGPDEGVVEGVVVELVPRGRDLTVVPHLQHHAPIGDVILPGDIIVPIRRRDGVMDFEHGRKGGWMRVL